MAIIKLGTTVVGIRGTIGGLTFSAGSSGPYARQWSRAPRSNSALQSQTRGRMSQIPELWQGMTQSERDDFDLFGLSPPELDFNSLGEQYYLTGWQWFVRINQRRQSMGLAPTTALPSDLGVSALSSITLAAAALPTGPVTIEWPAGELPAGYGSSLFMGAHPTLALKTMTSRLAQVWSQFEPAGTTADITASVLSRFGSLPAGYKLFAWCYRVREDGVRSPAATTTTEIL